MYNIKNDVSNDPEVESQTFSLIRNINVKVEHLCKKLTPITVSIPSNVNKDEQTTKLISELKKVDSKLAELLDTIVL